MLYPFYLPPPLRAFTLQHTLRYGKFELYTILNQFPSVGFAVMYQWQKHCRKFSSAVRGHPAEFGILSLFPISKQNLAMGESVT